MSPNENLFTNMNNQLQLTTASSYLKAALFIGANIALPHLFHLVPGGGVMFLPIYVFTLCGALCYGWRFGLLTAVMTPLAGYLLFDAPALVMVPDMMLKGAVLSVVAAWLMDKNTRAIKINPLLAVVASWLLVGLMEWPFVGAAFAFQDFVTGLPGMMLMTLAGMIALKLKS